MRTVPLVVLLIAVAAGAQAGVGTTTWDTGSRCVSDGNGTTCSRDTESWTGAGTDDEAGEGAGVWLIDESRWSEGNHGTSSPNAWNSSRTARGVGVNVADEEIQVRVGLREYSATQEEGGKTRRTTQNDVEVDTVGLPAGDTSSSAGFTERRVEGSYHRCIVEVAGITQLSFACGPESLEESPLP